MKFLFFLFFSISTSIFCSPPNAEELAYNKGKVVTYAKHGGRFGDQLLCYIHAKWISYYYGIPLLYKPFPYSDHLVLHNENQNFTVSRRLKTVIPSPNDFIDFNRKKKELYIIPYFPDSEWELEKGNTEWYHFPIDWKDMGFREELKRLIQPTHISPFLELPEDRISIALHVRKGGGVDLSDTWKGYPMKFPPQSYYIEQLKRISEIFPGKKFYAYIFTDHQDPTELIDEYQQYLPDVDIQFDCRKSSNNPSANVLEDFFEMMRFECLVIADSNFSIIPAKLGDYKVVIRPVNFQYFENTVYIDEVNVEISAELHNTKGSNEKK